VAALVSKCREATEAAQTGWSLARDVACERPPLLREEGIMSPTQAIP